ncbi:hypothetical protein [Thiocystis violascens]|uniref:Calcineurin-like phosphoesterase domain-containing protein n=1 Tax=Thiocystis violascens (strain ATCC 17096 / DSM 198 / 6111) TaxID=765911 RepID=I3Y7T4_THIV6|nr:hypothetical protein [Thiocystis violascens]AFL73052.1 hypothetical protein Thivi_1021 [Thiocystis violascens DSM 198]
MHGFSRLHHILFLVLLGCAATPASAAPLRFFATGDAPYAPAEMPQLQRLFVAAIVQWTPFLVHLGDIKSGSTPCADNGYREDDPAAMDEFKRRDKVNRAALRRAARLANERGARAMVLLFHADPFFHMNRSPRGFAATRRALVRLMAEYAGPVLLIHGDTHGFKHDRPLIDPGTGLPFPRFVRAEVPGSPVVGGIWVSVDPDADEPFAVEEVYPLSLDVLEK